MQPVSRTSKHSAQYRQVGVGWLSQLREDAEAREGDVDDDSPTRDQSAEP